MRLYTNNLDTFAARNIIHAWLVASRYYLSQGLAPVEFAEMVAPLRSVPDWKVLRVLEEDGAVLAKTCGEWANSSEAGFVSSLAK